MASFWFSNLRLVYKLYCQFTSPVNTEYQKRIYDTLTRINERLCSELKIGDERHFVRQLHMRQALEEICHEWKSNGASVEQYGLDLPDWPASKEWYEFHSLADDVRYTLFLPQELKDKTIAYLEERASAAEYAHNYAVKEYIEMVNRNKSFEELSPDNFIDIENLYKEGMAKSGMGVDQIHEYNEALLQAFIKYVQSFDPKS